MSEQENNLDLLQGKLYHCFEIYLRHNDNLNNRNIFLQNFVKNKLQKQYLNSMDSQYINVLLQKLQEYEIHKDVNIMMMNLSINNLKNEMIAKELLNFLDMTRNYEFEEKIDFLQKEVVELKKDIIELTNMNREQNSKLNELSEVVNQIKN